MTLDDYLVQAQLNQRCCEGEEDSEAWNSNGQIRLLQQAFRSVTLEGQFSTTLVTPRMDYVLGLQLSLRTEMETLGRLQDGCLWKRKVRTLTCIGNISLSTHQVHIHELWSFPQGLLPSSLQKQPFSNSLRSCWGSGLGWEVGLE